MFIKSIMYAHYLSNILPCLYCKCKQASKCPTLGGNFIETPIKGGEKDQLKELFMTCFMMYSKTTTKAPNNGALLL